MVETAGSAEGDARREYLTGVLADRNGQVFEGNVLAHLVALHALRQADPGNPVIEDGIAALEAIRVPGGGMPFITGQEIFVTALAALCLARAGAEDGLLERMGDFLSSAQHPDGGWGYTALASQSDVDDTSRCLEALRVISVSQYRETLDMGERYLLAMAGADGSFPTYVKGREADVDMTAGAILALGPRLGQRLTASAGFIASRQHRDGTFPVSWTLSTASVANRAIDALEASGLHSHSVKQAVRSLAQSQNPDGGFGQRPGMTSDVLSTAQAARALAGRAAGRVVPDALHYLSERQNSDGSFTSVPDQVGPRPIPFDFPVLATIHALNALNH
ncbi:prenyltransferase/squalene oxidase repeat-containing protein [Streptomyces sp. NPDC005492]|uniref:prenyltransferase/squalene oxidase repeat-containing protein n=1 Tax=Streptomyces sp. NPDC005492 TaxID=3156883 RepID=UPI0033BF5803